MADTRSIRNVQKAGEGGMVGAAVVPEHPPAGCIKQMKPALKNGTPRGHLRDSNKK